MDSETVKALEFELEEKFYSSTTFLPSPVIADEDPKDTEKVLPQPQPVEEYIHGFRLALVLISATLVYFLMMLDMSILATAIPYITDDFHSLLDVGWYGSAYQLACASLQPLTGKIYARLNSKYSYLVFLLVFEVGSLICGVATSSKMLIVGRAIAGMGGSGLMNGGLTILNSCVPVTKQPALLGMMMALGYLGIAFGPLIGGALTEYASWRWCFYINLPSGGSVALLLLALRIPDNIPKPAFLTVLRSPLKEFDLIGFALFAPSSIQFLLALQYGGNQYAWNSSTVIGLFCGAGATFLIWLAWDIRRGEGAMVPIPMLRKRIVWSSCATGLFFAGSFFITGYYLPIYFQDVKGASPLMSGVDVLPNILPQMLVTVIAGKMVEKLGYYLPFTLTCGVLNCIASGLLSLLSPHTATRDWVGYQVLLGIGRGLGVAMPILALQSLLPRPLVPLAMSTLVFAQNFGGAVAVSLSQTIFTNSLRTLIPAHAPAVDVDAVISAGPQGMRKMIGGGAGQRAELEGLLSAYGEALGRVFYLCAGMGVAAWLFSWGMGWRDIRAKKEGEEREKREREGEDEVKD